MFARIEDGVVMETVEALTRAVTDDDGNTYDLPLYASGLEFVPCPPQVGQHWRWNGETFSPPETSIPPVPATEERVREQCRRRILAVFSESAQRNALAVATGTLITYGADKTDWPEDIRSQVDADAARWRWVSAMRVACETLLSDIPADFYDDRHWPSFNQG